MSKEKEIKTPGFKKKHVIQRSFVKLGNTRGSYIWYKINSSNSILSLYKFSLYNQNLHLLHSSYLSYITIEGFSAKEKYATMIILRDIMKILCDVSIKIAQLRL